MTDQSQNLAPDVAALPDMPDVYEAWRRSVHRWISQRSRAELADAVLFTPDLLALIIRLMRDSRTPLFFKSQLLIVAIYIFSPVDFLPEAILGAAGLADDAVVASLVLLKVLQNAREVDPELMRELWSGRGDVVTTIQEIVDSGGEILNTRTWKRIRNFFGSTSPEPAVVDGHTSE